MSVDDERIALSDSAAARLASVSDRRLKAWEQRDLVKPSVRRRLSPRNVVRLYGFQDLLALLVVHGLIDRGASPRTVARLVDHLRNEYDQPLTQLRWAVDGKRVYVQHFDGSWTGDKAPDQTVFWEMLDLEPLRARIRNAITRGRSEQDIGQVIRHRGVMGSKPVFAGTRIPVRVVHAYLERGLGDDHIIQAFPQLTSADVNAARDEMAIA